MFEDLATHNRIVVTGPQRSGTRIAAKMIAEDTGLRYVDEGDFVVYDVAAWRRILAVDGVVVHSPAMLKPLVDDPPPGVFVVLMRRSLDDIHASADRIEWETKMSGNTAELAIFGLPPGQDSARLKYDYWESNPKRFGYLELEYESLRGHRLWVEKELRRDFGPIQTAL